MSKRWVALLRGINVGGRNRLAMADLRAALESIGLVDVRTYIQSGNVVFAIDPDAPVADNPKEMARAIADVIDEHCSLRVRVVVRTLSDIAQVAESHPDDGDDIPANLLQVILLDGPTDADRAPSPNTFAPDRWTLGDREVYVAYPDGSARSKLTLDVFEKAFGVTATARNLNTLRNLAALG